jgi:mannosyltransferase
MSATAVRSEIASRSDSASGARSRVWHWAPLALVLVIGLVLRLINLGHSYWGDETVTVHLLRESPWYMFRHGIPGDESTPPLYYVIASMWSRLFGTGEFALRSLTAIIGVATVAVAYPIGVELRSRRAGLILASLVAVSPLMVWFSQDARSYALLILLTSVALLFFAQALRTTSSKSIWLWAFASAAALTAHYFAAFVILPEALVLLFARKTRSRAVWPSALVAFTWIALLPLLLFQASHAGNVSWIKFLRLTDWLKLTLQFFETGSWALSFLLLAAVTAAIAGIVGYAFIAHRIDKREWLILGVGVSSILLPLIAALAGHDYFNYQNLVASWMPFAAVVAVALASLKRAGTVLAVAVCGLALAATVKIQATPDLQRPNWRQAAHVLSAEPPHTLFVIYPAFDFLALKWYGRSVSNVTSDSVRTRRVVVLAEDPWSYSAAHTLVLHTPAGFHETARRSFSTFVMVTYSAPRAVRVSAHRLSSMRPSGHLLSNTPWTSWVFFDRPARTQPSS